MVSMSVVLLLRFTSLQCFIGVYMYIVVGLYISIFDVYIEQFYVCENFKLICILVCTV